MPFEKLEIEDKLHAHGVHLPNSPNPTGHYVKAVEVNNLLYISGITCKWNGDLPYKGKLGRDLSIQEGYEASKISTLNHLAIIKDMFGGFNRVDRIIKLTGYVNCIDGYANIPNVVNGSSDLLVHLFGENGKHARCAVGVSSLPGNAAVETDLLLSIK